MFRILLWPVEFLKRHWMSIIVILGIIVLVAIFKTVDLPKFGEINLPKLDIRNIGIISGDQQWLIVGAIIAGIIAICLLIWKARWLAFALVILGGIAYVAFTRVGWDTAKEKAVSLKKMANSSVEYELRINSLETTEDVIPNIRAGDYRVEFYPRDTIYAIRCTTGGQLEFYFRSQDREAPATDMTRGVLLAKGGATKMEFAKSHGGIIRIGDDKRIIFLFKFGPVFGNKAIDPDCTDLVPPDTVRVLLTRE